MDKTIPCLELRDITKIYFPGYSLRKKKSAGVRALDNVSLTLKPGMYGLLGPNGAGKSTLISIVTNNLVQTKGQVLWKGKNIRALGIRYREILGFMPQQQNLYDTFTGRRFLTYLCVLKEIPKKETAQEVERTAAAFNLSAQLDKRLSAYSGGMKQRLLAAASIIGKPELVILDEPTAGLDPKERVRMRNYMKELSRSCVLLIATHVVSDVEDVADEIILLNKGQIVDRGAPAVLVSKYEACHKLEDVYLHIFGED